MAFDLNFGKQPKNTTDNSTSDFSLDGGLPEITQLGDLLGNFQSWGAPKSTSGGWDFNAPTQSAGFSLPLGNSASDSAAAAGSGWQNFSLGAQGLTGLASAYLGFQQINLAKDQLAQNKKIFNLNFGNQAQSVNTQLEDRQRARVASNSTGYQSVGEYMDKNKVSTKGL
jgi:hypothetical protein